VCALLAAGLALNTQAAAGSAEKRRLCHQELERRGVSFTPGPSQRGVRMPVTVDLPLGGISYYGYGDSAPQRSLFMDCRLAVALHRTAFTLKRAGIKAVEHLGIYSYRCIAGTDPCVLSQHARARAIDFHEFRSARGKAYNVEDDWLVDRRRRPTCSSKDRKRKNGFLHDLVCTWDAREIFNVILTPNYNAAHRNHIHVDLTRDEDFIR
jgi:hypothetical protein